MIRNLYSDEPDLNKAMIESSDYLCTAFIFRPTSFANPSFKTATHILFTIINNHNKDCP